MGRADQGLPRPNSHLPPEEPLSVVAVYLQRQPWLYLAVTRLHTLHVALPELKGQTRALELPFSRPCSLQSCMEQYMQHCNAEAVTDAHTAASCSTVANPTGCVRMQICNLSRTKGTCSTLAACASQASTCTNPQTSPTSSPTGKSTISRVFKQQGQALVLCMLSSGMVTGDRRCACLARQCHSQRV